MCEAVFVLSLGILALYIWPHYIMTSLATTGIFGVTLLVAIGAIVALFLSVVIYLVPLKKETFLPTLLLFLLFALTASGVVVTTGGTESPFIALWLLVAFFSAVFGVWGTVPLVFGVGVFLGYQYLHENFSASLVTITLFSGLLPIIAGVIVWWKSDKEGQGDAKEYKNLASELSEVANKSEVVINAIGDGVVALDAQGGIQLINPAAQSILGWGKQDAMSLSYKSILHLVDNKNNELESARDPIQQALNANQQVRTNNFTIITKSGKKLIASLVISPVSMTPGAGVIVVFRDITAETAEQREQAEFISTASHEMRTPVASIEGYLGLALNPQTAQIDAKARDFIVKAQESVRHLGQLFQDLLDVSKTDDGRMANNPKVVDVIPFVHDIVQSLNQKAVAKGITLHYIPMPDDGAKHIAPVYYVNLDNDHILEIVDNLIENAIKYTLAGEVVVDVSGDNDSVTISVKDSGVGIPVEDIPHLFQKFYRVDSPETRQIGGTGLGLYLCRRLAETMGGRIWLESQYQKGSTFYLELPRISSEQAATLRSEQERAAKMLVAPQPQTQAPVLAPTAAPGMMPLAQAPMQSRTTPVTQPATTVPRGESLTKEQIAAHVAQLEALARAQQTQTPAQPLPTAPPTPTQAAPMVQAPVAPTYTASRPAPVLQDVIRTPIRPVQPGTRG